MDATERERLVLVGRRWGDKAATAWATWEKPLDEVIATLTERQKDYRPGTSFEVIEVVVERRIEISSEVKVASDA